MAHIAVQSAMQGRVRSGTAEIGKEKVTPLERCVFQMTKLFDIINIPLSYVLRFFAGIFGGNFAAAVFVFTLLINVALIPLNIKSQKSTVQQTRIKPKLDELKKRYGDDKQKYNEAMQKLYQQEGVSMSGGCLPMIIRLILMLSIYNLIMRPLTYMIQIPSETITAATKALGDIAKNKNTAELLIVKAVNDGSISFPEIAKSLHKIDFNLFGIDLTQTPKFSFDIFHEAQLIWIIPISAFLAQMLTSVISMRINKKSNPDAPSMAGMMLTMPLLSLFIGFGLPGGVGFYWVCSSLLGGAVQSIIQVVYGPHRLLARERSKELIKQAEFEAKQIQKLSE